ncbi:MAG: RelA/SpoT family protein [Gemmatimonadota bacterium]
MTDPRSRETDVPAVTAVDPDAARALVAPLYVDRRLRTGEPFLAHADGMAGIVRPLRNDEDLLAAAYLFGLHDFLRDADDFVRAHFGAAVAQLVVDLRVLMRLSERTRGRAQADATAEAEALRKMLLAMVNDLRVVILRLASRLQTLRWYAATKQSGAEDFARETLQLYAPLANRLGIWQLKWELEDLALRFLEPQTYKQIARWLEAKRIEREAFIEGAITRLGQLLAEAGIRAEVSGRPKHIYSIWNKMRTKSLAFEQLYDVRALRVIVDDVAQCYQALSLVHQHWTPIGSEYDDYIARPKPNGYQSLHTVVRDAAGQALEIQIRTRAMHEAAELGVAAHWRYKEQTRARGRAARTEDERIAWLRQLLAWRADVSEPVGAGALAGEDRIYVLTPQAKVVELPAGSTPIDFAYHVHTELGHRCRGARVDGAMVPLTTRLTTGQTIEIVAAKTGGPSRDWLNADLGYLASPRSRAKVRQWFNALELAQSVAAGREIVERELARLGKTAVKLDDLARRLGFASVDEFYVAATKEEFSLRSIEQALTTAPGGAAEVAVPALPAATARAAPAAKGKVLVVGVDSLLTMLARCCRPVPPDEIIGFVTRGKGVSIHRANCVNARALAKRAPERLIDVTWGGQAEAAYPVDVFVLAADRHGLLRDVSEVFAREKMNVIGVNTLTRRGEAQMQFTIEVADTGALRRALAELSEVDGVISARRR